MNSNSKLLPWLVWTVAALFVVFNYIQQAVPNIIAEDLSRAFSANESTLGNIAACYFYAYAVMQIPVGLIVDRFGTRWPLVVAVAAAGLGTLGFAWAPNAGSAQLTRVLMGASAAFSFICCLKLVQVWFPITQFSTLAGLTNTASMVGFASGPVLVLMVKSAGWRDAMVWMGVGALMLAVLVFLLVRDKPAIATQPAAKPKLGEMFGVLKNSQVWINATYCTTISLVYACFGGLWGKSYMQKVYGLDAIAAAGSGTILALGGIVGSLFFGWFSDYLKKRKPPMIMAGAGALFTMAAMLYMPGLPLLGFKIGLFLVGFFSSANIVSYAVARDLYPQLAGLSIGFLSTCYYLGSGASLPLVGSLLEQRSHGGGMEALTPGDFRYGLSPLVIFMGVGLISSLLIRETVTNPVPKTKA